MKVTGESRKATRQRAETRNFKKQIIDFKINGLFTKWSGRKEIGYFHIILYSFQELILKMSITASSDF